MTRKWFLGLIGLGAAGQTTVTIYAPKDRLSTEKPVDLPGASLFERNNVTIPYHTVEHQPYKPANGECPVCGTMAPTYRRMMVSMGFMAKCKPTPGYRADDVRTWVVQCEEVKDWDGPQSRTVRCAHCSAAFWQDAEDVK